MKIILPTGTSDHFSQPSLHNSILLQISLYGLLSYYVHKWHPFVEEQPASLLKKWMKIHNSGSIICYKHYVPSLMQEHFAEALLSSTVSMLNTS